MGKKRYIAPDDAKSWERRTGETTQAFSAFAKYRGMGHGRSLAKVAQELGKSKTIVERWSRQWDWVNRVADHDHDEDRRLRDHELQVLQRMKERHLGFAQVIQQIASHPITELQKRVKAGKDPGLTAMEAVKLLETGMKLERLFRGEPDSISQHSIGINDRRNAVRRLLRDPDASGAIDKLTRSILADGPGE